MQKSNGEWTYACEATLNSLARALELRDRDTEGHTRRVVDLCVKLARHVGMRDEQLDDLKRGAQLHDIGKLGIPDNILLKPEPLNSEEWQIMRQHPQYAVEILGPMVFPQSALDIPHYHHEKWDGSGYPEGLRGEAIPLSARIFCIVDVWDALTSDRPYRRAWSKKKAIQYMREQSGKHFDPCLLRSFLDMIRVEVYGSSEQFAWNPA